MLKHKNKLIIFASILLSLFLSPATVLADIPIPCPDGYQTTVNSSDDVSRACASHQAGSSTNDGVEEAKFSADCKKSEINQDNCGIIAYLVRFINILSGLVGIVVVIMITIGGIQYAAAGSNPQAVVAARKRIINAVLALVLYIFMFAFLQWLVPGGIF